MLFYWQDIDATNRTRILFAIAGQGSKFFPYNFIPIESLFLIGVLFPIILYPSFLTLQLFVFYGFFFILFFLLFIYFITIVFFWYLWILFVYNNYLTTISPYFFLYYLFLQIYFVIYRNFYFRVRVSFDLLKYLIFVSPYFPLYPPISPYFF